MHTQPVSAPEQLPYLTEIAIAAFSGSAYSRFTRPRYAEFPRHTFHNALQKIRNAAISPGTVVRVAVADDADAWVDLSIRRRDAERSRWPGGELVDGNWLCSEHRPTVCEGRALGHAIWERRWPDNAADATRARARAGTAWPTDALWKKAERAALRLASAYRSRINPDPAVSGAAMALLESEGEPQLTALLKPALDRCKHVGHLTLHSLAVDPAFHRCGVGARLMRWGIDRAEAEGCPILLVATVSGARLYERLGFVSYGVITVKDLTGDQVMAYWPRSFADMPEEKGSSAEHVAVPETNSVLEKVPYPGDTDPALQTHA